MSNKKKSKNKAIKGHNRGGRENSPRGQPNSSSSLKDNSITDQQRRDNGGTGSRTNGIQVAVRLFRNPLFTKRGLKQVREGLKSESSGDSKSGLRRAGSFCLLFYPWFLTGYSIDGLLFGDKNNSIHVFVYANPLFTAIPYCIKYLDDVDTLLLSTFEIGEKSMLTYFADPGIRELLLTVFEIAGFIYQCVKGRQTRWIFICGIAGFICYLLGNIFLILGRKKRPESVANDLT